LFGDTVPPEQRQRYEEHLETCAACQERLDRAQECGDALVGLVRQVGDPARATPDPALAAVLARLRQHGSEDEEADLYFLRPSDRAGVLGALGQYEVREV